ncbi:MAG TPA: alcohol dehydrogenase catalytic domain-containing protein [Acidobacteriota bacterium]|nr:alcohol dehydrogenase catalytic domain-containing protein [Acidobacteriota bacterium]HNC43303.1 alcohol dehydrogenase catalytic domain-containing protein [Acidobacteriota bacterium]
MLALRFEHNQLALRDIPLPVVEDRALIRMTRAGICATDLAITRGYASFSGTIGHEFVGIVEQSPDPEWVGKRVVGNINIGCGNCRECHRGDSRHCALRQVLGIRSYDGAFAEYLALPIRNLHLVPDALPDSIALFAEPLAAACRILEQLVLQPDQSIVVLGDGKLGQLIARMLKANGFNPLLIGKYESKRTLAEQVGIQTRTLNEKTVDVDLRQTIDVVIEATGNSQAFAQALELVSPCGTIVLKSTLQGNWALKAENFVVPEITVVGSRCGRLEHSLALLESGKIEVASLISAEFPLAQALDAFRVAAQPGMMKVQLLGSESEPVTGDTEG